MWYETPEASPSSYVPRRSVISSCGRNTLTDPYAQGNMDWVFNNTPVFFLRDPAKFPSRSSLAEK